MKVCSSSLNSTVFVVAGTNAESRSLPTFPASNSCRGLSVGPSDTLNKNNTVSKFIIETWNCFTSKVFGLTYFVENYTIVWGIKKFRSFVEVH